MASFLFSFIQTYPFNLYSTNQQVILEKQMSDYYSSVQAIQRLSTSLSVKAKLFAMVCKTYMVSLLPSGSLVSSSNFTISWDQHWPFLLTDEGLAAAVARDTHAGRSYVALSPDAITDCL